jgi:hypothetical protein
MAWLNGLSDDDRKEMFDDNCDAYNSGVIGFDDFVRCLAKLGYNATDIAELERFYRPTPPENEDDNG